MKYRIVVGVGVFCLAWLPSCGVREAPRPPDMVVVVVNGWRAQVEEGDGEDVLFDALGLSQGRGFRAAYAQSPNPVSSLASMMVGEYPSAIPFCIRPRTRDNKQEPWCTNLPPERRLLPEILSLYGYSTGLFVRGELGGIGKIGERFDQVSAGTSAELGTLMQAWWTTQAESHRFAVVVIDLVPALRRSARVGARSAALGDVLQEAYRKEVEATGAWVQEMLGTAFSKTEGRARVVVMTSGHGVSLAETTGTWELPVEHVFHDIVLDRTVHVPLRIFGAGEGKDVETPVQLVDLLPTLTGLGGAAEPAGLPGRDLLGAPPGSGQAYAEFGDMLALRQGGMLLGARMLEHGASSLDPKITERLLQGVEPQVRFTLHDVEVDPRQTRDVSRERPEVVTELRTRLGGVRQDAAGRGPGMSREQVEALRNAGALDYW